MIRINLLPVREERRKAGLRQQGVLLGIAAAIGVVIALGMHWKVSADIGRAQAEIRAAQAELASLEETRKRVEAFRKEKEEIERKLNVIAELEASRKGPVRLLDEIATRIPRRMWLDTLEMKGSKVSLEGVSLDAEIVAEFLTNLEESPFFKKVELGGTKLEEKDGLRLNVFEVESNYDMLGGGSLPAAPAN